MVYDDYADIGIFAKWVMDAPESGAGTSIGGRKMSLHEKGDQTRALNHNSNLQTVFVWTFQIRKRLRISLPKFVEEAFYPSENPVRFRRRFGLGQMKGTLICEPSFCPIAW